MKYKSNLIKLIFLFNMPVLLLFHLTGCGLYEFNQKPITSMWIVTERTTSDSFNYQIKCAVAAFEAEHKGIQIQVDILPTDTSEREIYLKQLRTQIMAGEGPDVYILPTNTILAMDSPTIHTQEIILSHIEVDPLFPDVMQAMYSGVFADISSFYDADTDLNTETLQQDVMDAGMIDGCRYVLPLRYTMPVLLTEPSNYDRIGITQEQIDSGIDDLVKYALEADDTMMAIGLQMPDDSILLSQIFDYENGRLLISQEEIAGYMRLYQWWYSLSGSHEQQIIGRHLDEVRTVMDEATHYSYDDILSHAMVDITLNSFNNVYDYGRYGYHWSLEGFPLYSDSLTGVLDQTAIAKVLGKDLEAQPMRSTDGSVIAEVSYYGAIGSGCTNVELAYEFLRVFLTEEYQWDLVRPRAKRENIDIFNLPQEKQVRGMIEDSWPVRTVGATPYLWDTLQYQNFHEMYVYENLHKQLKDDFLNISDADLPILQVEMDEVRFPFYQPYEETLEYALTLLNNEDGTPTDVDIDKLARQVYQYLWWHLAEG